MRETPSDIHEQPYDRIESVFVELDAAEAAAVGDGNYAGPRNREWARVKEVRRRLIAAAEGELARLASMPEDAAGRIYADARARDLRTVADALGKDEPDRSRAERALRAYVPYARWLMHERMTRGSALSGEQQAELLGSTDIAVRAPLESMEEARAWAKGLAELEIPEHQRPYREALDALLKGDD